MRSNLPPPSTWVQTCQQGHWNVTNSKTCFRLRLHGPSFIWKRFYEHETGSKMIDLQLQSCYTLYCSRVTANVFLTSTAWKLQYLQGKRFRSIWFQGSYLSIRQITGQKHAIAVARYYFKYFFWNKYQPSSFECFVFEHLPMHGN